MPETLLEDVGPTSREAPEAAGTVALCVCTYGRPQALCRLLESLVATVPPSIASAGRYEVRVVVVDNDVAEPNRQLTQEIAERAPWPLEYVVEPRRGIPHARNAAVRACSGTADFVAWIDDDEVPAPGWLEALLSAQHETGADVVAGPIVPRFESPPAAWVEKGGFFERPRFQDRSQITYARAGNALVAVDLFRLSVPPFNESFALAGGEDTYFFRQVFLAGKKITWADDALVTEFIPASRARTSWLLRRAYRRGNTLSVTLVGLEGSWRRRLKRAAHAGLATIHGIALLLAAPFRGRPTLVRALQRICFAAGLLTGLTGRTYVEYTNVHGK
jgi:succinoglycan biosynthesis protein ExoM